MHSKELIEIASGFSTFRDSILLKADPVGPAALRDYWTASTARYARWTKYFAEWKHERDSIRSNGDEQSPQDDTLAWAKKLSCLEEVLLSELPARIFAAASKAIDARFETHEWFPVANAVFLRHMEFRQRVLESILADCKLPSGIQIALNQLRRRLEYWVDHLLAPWQVITDVESLAFDAERLGKFRQTVECGGSLSSYWETTCDSVQGAFRHALSPDPFCGDYNRKIAAAMISCFADSLLKIDDCNESEIWIQRLFRVASQTEQILEVALRSAHESSQSH